MLQSTWDRPLKSGKRASRKAGSSYTIHSRKDKRVGFARREADTTMQRLMPFAPRAFTPSPSPVDQEWHAMEEQIKAAEFVLHIENDLESDDFVPYTRETLSRAVQFLRRLMIHALSAGISGMGLPRIGPADHGSIDLFWEKSDRTLLINFPASAEFANFYGRKTKSEISGRFHPSEAQPELAVWLAE